MAAEPAAGWLADYLAGTLYTSPPVFVTLVGGLIKAMDENSSNNNSAKLHANSWAEFAASLTSFTRSLMAGPLGASSQLSTRLLDLLGLDPEGGAEVEWPLFVPPRRLAILAQVLVARQTADTDTYSTRVTGLYIRLWERTVNRMMAAATEESDNDDINVEHVQLLLMLFHALQLLQKKQVLLHAANQLIALSGGGNNKPHQSVRHALMVARLALLVDYMIRHLYEPPAALLDQIQTNLFNQGSGNSRPCYFPSPDHPEDGEEGSGRPHYFLLSPLPGAAAASTTSYSMEVPKLDGLAVSFLLTSPESLDYASLYEALVSSLDSVYAPCDSSPHPRGCRGVSYSFAVVWRLLHSLPPPAPFLVKLAMMAAADRGPDDDSDQPPLSYGLSLHALILGQRAANKAFSTWIREGLTKQGLLLGKAESLVKAVSTDVNSITFELHQLQSFLLAMEDKLQAPALSLALGDLLLLDCLIAKFQISLDKIFLMSSKLSSSPGLAAVEGLVGLSDLEALKAAAEWSGGGSLAQAVEAAQQLVPGVARLVSQLSQAGRSALLHRYQQKEEAEKQGIGSVALSTLMHSLSLAGTRCQVIKNCLVKKKIEKLSFFNV